MTIINTGEHIYYMYIYILDILIQCVSAISDICVSVCERGRTVFGSCFIDIVKTLDRICISRERLRPARLRRLYYYYYIARRQPYCSL